MLRPLILSLLLAGCTADRQLDTSNAPPLAQGTAYDDALNELEAKIDGQKRLLRGTDWSRHQRLASLYLRHAKLTGDYAGYDSALEQLELAFELAKPGSGPHEVQAAVLQSLHRLAESDEALTSAHNRIAINDTTLARLTLLRGTTAWQRGDYEGGARLYERAMATRKTYDNVAAMAHHSWHMGNYKAANTAFDEAAQLLRPEQTQAHAWLELQRGLMDLDRSRYASALEHYRRADALFPGWWLVHEHIAEAMWLSGDLAGAEAIYVGVIERTHHPEFYDALANLRRERREGVDALIAQSAALYDVQLTAHPEAAAGHAVAHYLDFGPAPTALIVAERNVQARPGAESHLRLAQAHLANDQVPAAVRSIETALDMPWRTPELHDVAAEIYTTAGRSDDAIAQRSLAAALRR